MNKEQIRIINDNIERLKSKISEHEDIIKFYTKDRLNSDKRINDSLKAIEDIKIQIKWLEEQ